MPPERVLVVGDEPEVRESLCELLLAWGYEIEGAGDG
jgi:CheY-like chemotaxis protein